MAELADRVALVTGAARGQGAAQARRLAEAGARVAVTDTLAGEGRAVAAELGEAAVFIPLDVSDDRQWRTAVATTLDAFGRLDVLVNNAGVYHTCPLLEESAEGFERLYRVNLIGALLGIQAAFPALRDASGGSIVNISSTAGLTGYPNHGAYSAAKWALRGMTKVAALELAPFRIRVNSVHPGVIDTPMTASRLHPADGAAADLTHVPLGRAGLPEEVAELVLFLASPASSYITGAEITADGGALAGRFAGQRELGR